MSVILGVSLTRWYRCNYRNRRSFRPSDSGAHVTHEAHEVQIVRYSLRYTWPRDEVSSRRLGVGTESWGFKNIRVVVYHVFSRLRGGLALRKDMLWNAPFSRCWLWCCNGFGLDITRNFNSWRRRLRFFNSLSTQRPYSTTQGQRIRTNAVIIFPQEAPAKTVFCDLAA